MATKKNFNYKLLFSLMIVLFIPSIYETFRVYFISDLPNTSSLSIAGQMEWFDLIDETIQSFLIIPLYFIFNQVVDDTKQFKERIQEAGILVGTLYLLFSIGVYIYSTYLVNYMTNPTLDSEAILHYVRLETIAFIIGIAWDFFTVVFVLIGKSRYFIILLVIKTLAIILGDSYLIPSFGVNGIAYSNILVNTLIALTSVLLLWKENLLYFKWHKFLYLSWVKDWFKAGSFSGSQVFLDNIFYALMIAKMINEVADQGTYWVANNFIWGWLLVPIFALSEMIKRDCKNGFKQLNICRYHKINAVFITVWIASIPLWNWIFTDWMNLSDSKEVFYIVIKLLPFYIAYSISSLYDSIFYGLGQTIYPFFNSLICNLMYYGTFFILFRYGFITPDLNFIILLFGFGLVMHLIITLIFIRILRNKKQ